MEIHRRWVRVLRVSALAAGGLLLLLVAAVQGQQRLLRWRAERLLSDIKAIQMGKSTWADAQRLMNKWGAWGGWEGSCSAQRCDYQIALEDAFRVMPVIFMPSGDEHVTPRRCCRWLYRPYRLLGGRFSVVAARIEVKDGIIWTKSFDVGTMMYPRLPGSNETEPEVLVAVADGVTRFNVSAYWRNLLKHPEYVIEVASTCSGCALIRANLTRFAEPAVIDAAFDFNLDCLTRWKECEAPSEIMPSAFQLWSKEKELPDLEIKQSEVCTYPLDLLGRDSKFATIAEIESLRLEHMDQVALVWVKLRSLESLKNGAMPKLIREEPLGSPNQILAGGQKVGDIRPGSRIIVLSGERADDPDVVSAHGGPCSFVTYSQSMLEVIRKGIALDVLREER